ncbi:MAG: hypothetical protein ABEK10_01330 [Candidatus Nanosalina sp.]
MAKSEAVNSGKAASESDLSMANRQLEAGETEVQAEELERMLEKNDVDVENENLFAVYDKDGPLEDPEVSTPDIHDGVEEVVGTLEAQPGFVPAVVSGWDVDTLSRRRESYLNDDFMVAGSMGTVAEIGSEKQQVHPEIDKNQIYRTFQNVFQQAAEYDGSERDGLKISPQGNFSNIVASIKFEAENERAHVGEIADDPTTEELYNAIAERGGEQYFSRYEEDGQKKLVFENSEEGAEMLADVLTQDFIYPGVRFEETEGGRIAFYRDSEDAENFDKQDGYDLLTEATPEGVDDKPYDDWGSDMIVKVDEEFGKPQGVSTLAEEAFDGEEYRGLMIGDSETDREVAQENEDIYFVAIRGSEAHEQAINDRDWERGTDYVVAENAVDFTEALTETMVEHREDWQHEYLESSADNFGLELVDPYNGDEYSGKGTHRLTAAAEMAVSDSNKDKPGTGLSSESTLAE